MRADNSYNNRSSAVQEAADAQKQRRRRRQRRSTYDRPFQTDGDGGGEFCQFNARTRMQKKTPGAHVFSVESHKLRSRQTSADARERARRRRRARTAAPMGGPGIMIISLLREENMRVIGFYLEQR